MNLIKNYSNNYFIKKRSSLIQVILFIKSNIYIWVKGLPQKERFVLKGFVQVEEFILKDRFESILRKDTENPINIPGKKT